MPATLTKAMAIDATIQSLGMNRSQAAEKTLEQIVMGQIDFGGHGKQAAQDALLQLAFHPSPQSEAFLLRILSEADETIRPGDHGVYPAADLRADTAHVLAKTATPSLRLQLAKAYIQSGTSAAVRSKIEEIVKAPIAANFAAQLELFRSSETSDALKEQLQKALLNKNESAMKLALRLEGQPASGFGKPGFPGSAPTDASAGKSGLGGLLGTAVTLFGGGTGPKAGGSKGGFPGPPGMGGLPGAPPGMASPAPAAITGPGAGVPGVAGAKNNTPPAVTTPAIMALTMMGQTLSAQPIDLSMVERELWTPDFVETISKKLGDKGQNKAVINALASIPAAPAREKLKQLLKKDAAKGPNELGSSELVSSTASKEPASGTASKSGGKKKKEEQPAAPAGARSFGMGMGFGMRGGMQQQAKPAEPEVGDFGKDWLDPGALVVIKSTVTYDERPPQKPSRRSSSPYQSQMSHAAEKRAQERAAKQKALEAGYVWREAIAKLVHQWDERFSAVAEAPSESPSESEADKGSSSSLKGSKKDTGADESKTSASVQPNAHVPIPAVAMPFALHAGASIVKEFHLRWPQDLAAAGGTSLNDPLIVDYVRLEGKGDFPKTITHYKSALGPASPGTKVAQRTIEDGKWIDAVHKDSAKHRTRSIDVFLTRQASDDEEAKETKTKKAASGQNITVEILLVEIETPGPDSSPSKSRKEARETTSLTPR